MPGSPEVMTLQDYQAVFAARIRNPAVHACPDGIAPRRMQVYEDLLFNNLQGFLLACFPVARSLLGDPAWQDLARRFFAEHRCVSPLFRDIPGEFVAWMKQVAPHAFAGQPWLYELLHYEWLELVVSTDAGDVPAAELNPQGDLVQGVPVLTPSARLACYHYPVHRIGPEFIPGGQDNYCYLLYRNARFQVSFMLLNTVTARLVELIAEQAMSGYGCLQQLALELNQTLDHDPQNSLFSMGHELLEKLRLAEVILGTLSRR